MKMIYKILTCLILLVSAPAFSQEADIDTTDNKFRKIVTKGIRLKLTKSGSSYIMYSASMQFWYRYAQLNPGSVSSQTGEAISTYQDFNIRRTDISSLTNIENVLYIFFNYGISNNVNYNSLEKGLYWLDFWGKFRIAKNTYLGAGLHMFSGLSRYTMVGGYSQMTLDFPVTPYPNINTTNQINRQYGIFLHGRLSNFDYTFSLNQLLMPKDSGILKNDEEILELNDPNVAYNRRFDEGFSYKGYLSYAFLNKEPIPQHGFTSMTHLGKYGKILNVGAGFNFAADAAGAIESSFDTEVTKYNQSIWSVDVFYETPFKNRSSLTIYANYYNANYGPNYLTEVGVMGSFAQGGTSLNGAGITEFNFGTGDMAYLSIGYVIPKNIISGKNSLMPFYSTQYRNLHGLNEASFQHYFGLNYLIIGNQVKLSAQFNTRPIYDKEDRRVSDNKGMFIMQMQFCL
jgi:hypothetical protein